MHTPQTKTNPALHPKKPTDQLNGEKTALHSVLDPAIPTTCDEMSTSASDRADSHDLQARPAPPQNPNPLCSYQKPSPPQNLTSKFYVVIYERYVNKNLDVFLLAKT